MALRREATIEGWKPGACRSMPSAGGSTRHRCGNDRRGTEGCARYIPVSAVHRLANQGKIPLELIEVQTGSYLGEDDIVRLDDVYGRCWINCRED
jgi:Mannose-6-phosphate isomerase